MSRVLVPVVLADVAAGERYESIARGYHITEEDIRAALLFATDLAQHRYLTPAGTT